MRFREFSHYHGKELLETLHPGIAHEVEDILYELEPYPHGKKKGETARKYLIESFVKHDWMAHVDISFNTEKTETLDLMKQDVAIEVELSRFEMMFKEFLKFSILYQQKNLDCGILLTFDDEVFSRWLSGVPSHEGVRASLEKARSILNSKYGSAIIAPIWVIGIE